MAKMVLFIEAVDEDKSNVGVGFLSNDGVYLTCACCGCEFNMTDPECRDSITVVKELPWIDLTLEVGGDEYAALKEAEENELV